MPSLDYQHMILNVNIPIRTAIHALMKVATCEHLVTDNQIFLYGNVEYSNTIIITCLT